VSCDHFNRSYYSPADFTLCLTGNIVVEEVIPLIEKYVASIPVPEDAKEKLSPKVSFTPLSPLPPTPVLAAEVARATEAPSMTIVGSCRDVLLCCCRM
jgi:predicted Zn-dependent peptidase